MIRPTYKARHFLRLFTDFDRNPNLYTDLEIETRTMQNIEANPKLITRPATHYQFYDQTSVDYGKNIKAGVPYNFSKLKKL